MLQVKPFVDLIANCLEHSGVRLRFCVYLERSATGVPGFSTCLVLQKCWHSCCIGEQFYGWQLFGSIYAKHPTMGALQHRSKVKPSCLRFPWEDLRFNVSFMCKLKHLNLL